MNKLILLALLIALTACAARKQQPARYTDTKTLLAQIDKEPFGNTIITAIALNMAAKGPIEEVQLLLDEIVDLLNQSQGRADEKNRTDQSTCDETIGGFNQQIAALSSAISSLENSISENTNTVTQAQEDLAQAKTDYDETLQAITEGTQQREAEHSAWADNDYQQSVQIATLEEGVKLIQHMIHGVAFAQVQARYEKVLDKLKSADNKHTMLFKPLVVALSQLSNKLNYENVMQILDLLQNIRAGILEEQVNNRNSEEQSQSDWETLLNQLNNQKNSLSDKKQRLGNLIDSTEALLVQLKTSLENYRVELENVQGELASQEAWCDDQSEQYQADTAEREREVETLTQLQDHINEKFSAVSDYVSSRDL